MRSTAKTKDRKRRDSKWLYRACHSRAALELYLQPFADAQRFSDQLESKAAQLERETNDESKWSALERPFFDKGGFGGEKLHRSTLRTLIDLARENARVFFPQGLQYDRESLDGPPIFEAQWPDEKTLSRIAGDRFLILVYRAILEPNGDFLRVSADVIEEDAKPLKEILGCALRYQVELVQKAALELVDEAAKRDRAARSTLCATAKNGSLLQIGETWTVDGDYYTITAIDGNTVTLTGMGEPHEEIDGRRCFVPTKQQVKDRVIKLFRKERIGRGRAPRWRKPNPKDWSHSMWTKVFASAGLADLKEERGNRAKDRKATIARHSRKKGQANSP
jgi:hypothetical protein